MLMVPLFSCLLVAPAFAEAPALEKPAEPTFAPVPLVRNVAGRARLRNVKKLLGSYRAGIDVCAKLARINVRSTTIHFTASKDGRARDVHVQRRGRRNRAFDRCVALKANEWILPRGPKLALEATFGKRTLLKALPTL